MGEGLRATTAAKSTTKVELPARERERDSRTKRQSDKTPEMPRGTRHRSKLEKEMQVQMLKMVAEGMDVAEIYSPPRIAARAKNRGLKGGWGLDLTTKDERGRAWDFSKKEVRQKAMHKIMVDKPLLIVGSPTCTDWSTMMYLNWPRMSEEAREKRMTRGDT